MVELATVAVADTVPFAFAAGLALTAPQEGDVIGHLVARLRDKRVLIVVDNCEHLLAAAADAVERIVAGCPRAVVLVTSREPLMIRGERMVPVPPLSPEEAERLFLERARDEAPDLVIDAEQAQAVVELCRRLDGLPLALELAASRVRAFSPVELVTNLEQRFRMLVGGRRSRMQRHQTMRGTLDWSYDLCTEVEQTVFDRLSVFPASFDLAAARAIAGGDDVSDFDIGEVVPQLVDRSLLQRSTAPDGTTRYRMLETMRAYGRECLQRQGSDEWARCQHARYMAATIGPLTLRTFGPDERQVMQRLSEYLSDSLVALDWCIAHQEWENGLRVIPLLNELSERESNEMCSRLHDAALAGGAPDDLLDELAGHDKSRFLQHISQSTERGWRLIRDRSPIPVGWFASSPYLFFADGGLAAGDVDEFLDSLDRWLAAPPASRLLAEWSAVRALAHSGHLDRVEQPLSRLTNFATDLHSANANRFTDELHGTVARMRHDWPGAARWYAKVVESGGGRLNSWIDLAAAWHLLTARCLSPEDIDITGSELRDPWTCCLELRFDELRWHGATTTALALQRLEHPDLANRFAVWATRNDQIGAMSFFVVLLEIAGLPTRTIESNDNLDTLIEELFTIADDLELP